MSQHSIDDRLLEVLARLKEAADAVVWCDPDQMDERLMDELADAAVAAEDVLAGKAAAGDLT